MTHDVELLERVVGVWTKREWLARKRLLGNGLLPDERAALVKQHAFYERVRAKLELGLQNALARRVLSSFSPRTLTAAGTF